VSAPCEKAVAGFASSRRLFFDPGLGVSLKRRDEALRTPASRTLIDVVDEVRLLRFSAGKAHLRAAFHAHRLLVETLGFVLWHTPRPRHWVLGQGSHHRFLPASNQNLLFTDRTPILRSSQLHRPSVSKREQRDVAGCGWFVSERRGPSPSADRPRATSPRQGRSVGCRCKRLAVVHCVATPPSTAAAACPLGLFFWLKLWWKVNCLNQNWKKAPDFSEAFQGARAGR
jgi:hypothetical protein